MKILVGNRVDGEFVDRKSLLWEGGCCGFYSRPYLAGLSILIRRKPRKPASRANYAGIPNFLIKFLEFTKYHNNFSKITDFLEFVWGTDP
jgi:hypothetical protein